MRRTRHHFPQMAVIFFQLWSFPGQIVRWKVDWGNQRKVFARSDAGIHVSGEKLFLECARNYDKPQTLFLLEIQGSVA